MCNSCFRWTHRHSQFGNFLIQVPKELPRTVFPTRGQQVDVLANFVRERTTSLMDHDLCLLCRGKRIWTILEHFFSIHSWVQADTASAACPAQPCGLAMTSHYFRCCHLRRRRTLFSKVQHKIQNHLSQCHLGERLVPCFSGYIGSHWAFLRWQMSIKVAKWTVLLSLCASRITSFCLPTLSNCQAGLVFLSFFHASSTAAFASWIFIAWGIGTNLCAKLQWLIELYPLSDLWSSWSFGRVGSKRFLVDSWASTMHACFVFWIFLDSSLSLTLARSFFERFFVSPFCKALPPPWESPNFASRFDGFSAPSIFQIDGLNASRSSSVVDLWLFNSPLLLLLPSCLLTCRTNFQATHCQVW